MDFVHDRLAPGKKLRILTVIDTHSRYCPGADARFTYRGQGRRPDIRKHLPEYRLSEDDRGG
jgi:hypothetical protein